MLIPSIWRTETDKGGDKLQFWNILPTSNVELYVCLCNPAMFANSNCLQTSVKPWSREPYFWRAELRGESERWLRKLTPKLTLWQSRCDEACCSHSEAILLMKISYQALTTKILNLVQQAANYKQLRKVGDNRLMSPCTYLISSL